MGRAHHLERSSMFVNLLVDRSFALIIKQFILVVLFTYLSIQASFIPIFVIVNLIWVRVFGRLSLSMTFQSVLLCNRHQLLQCYQHLAQFAGFGTILIRMLGMLFRCRFIKYKWLGRLGPRFKLSSPVGTSGGSFLFR